MASAGPGGRCERDSVTVIELDIQSVIVSEMRHCMQDGIVLFLGVEVTHRVSWS